MPGLGPARVKTLLTHFGSVKRLREAGRDEIAEVKGIGPVLAESIVARLAPARPGPATPPAAED